MTKISELPVAATPDGTEVIPVVQGGVTKRSTTIAQAAVAGLVNDLAGKQATIPAGTYVEPPSAAEKIIYVSPQGDDVNTGQHDGSGPKGAVRNIARAKTLLGAGPGIIELGVGSFDILTADSYGNGLTLDFPGQCIRGSKDSTQVHIRAVGLTWGIKATKRNCEISGLLVYVYENLPYGVGTSCAANESAQASLISDVQCIYNAGATGTANFAIGPDNPGVASMDLALITFERCQADGATPGAVVSSFQIGNGTAGNVLQNSASGCQGRNAQYGITFAGSGITWTAGGFTGITKSDLRVTAGGGDPIVFMGSRHENGNQLLTAGYIGPVSGGVTLYSVQAGNYTPTEDGTRIITWNSPSALRIIGGTIQTTAATETVGVNTLGDPNAISFTAIDVVFSNANPYPSLNLGLRRRTIIGAKTFPAGGFVLPNDGFTFVVDPVTSMAAKVFRTANYDLVNVATTAVPWDSEEDDASGFHDNDVNPSRLTVPAGGAGSYLIGVSIAAASAVDGRFIVEIRKNGVLVRAGRLEIDVPSGTTEPCLSVSVQSKAVAGDYFEATYYRQNGGTVAMNNPVSGFWCSRLVA